MATDIKPPAYIPQGTFSGYITPQKNIERRQRLADVLAMQGMDTSPVQSPWQALARVAQAGAGAYGNYQAGQMEQQRYKALGEVMRGGMSPEQMFATGDPQMMQLGQFMIEQQRLKMAQEQQTAMLGAMTQEQRRANIASERAAPGVQQTATIEAEHAGLEKRKAEAAARFAAKIRGIYGDIGVGETKDAEGNIIPDFTNARDDLFGPLQGGVVGSIASVGPTLLGYRSEADRRRLESNLRAASRDYAEMRNPEHPDYEGALASMPQLTVRDAQAAYDEMQNRLGEATGYLGSPAPEGVTVAPLPAPGPQHPLQRAPKPRVDARAGEVPLPRPAMVTAPPTGDIPPMPTDDPRLTPDVWARMSPEERTMWMQSQ